MARVTPKGLLELLGKDADHWDLVASSPAITEDGLDEILARGNERTPYSFETRIKSREQRGRGGPYGTGGDHVGRDLSNKEKPEGLDQRGPDPMRERKFVGYEFQGMLMFDAKGKPAFHSLWPEGTPPEERKSLKINIVTKVPDYVLDPEGTVKPFMDSRTKSFGGKSLEEAFTPVDERVIAQFQKYSENFEKTFGIKLDISFDEPDADTHISVMGFRDGDRRLNGFASFPKGMQSWEMLKPYGHTPGFMVLNMDNVDNMTDKRLHDLVAHEYGHALGWAHPHDLAKFESLTQREAIEMTTMSYSDIEYRPFNGMEGAELGPMDYGLRKWVHNPPALNQGNAVYDLEAQHKETVELNKHTLTYRRERILPAQPILAHGENNELRGTQGDDFLDTNTGYSSQIANKETGDKQKFVLVEGHIERVKCVAGQNKVVACATGNQEISTGTGHTEVQCLYPNMSGEKTIINEGQGSTLVLSTKVLKAHQDMASERDGDDLVLRAGEGSIRLKGQAVNKGITQLRVVDELGKTVFEKDVSALNPDSFRRHGLYEAKKIAREHVPSATDMVPEKHEQPSWKDRIQSARLRQKGDINEGPGL